MGLGPGTLKKMPCYRGWLGLETALEWPKTASKIPVSGDLIMLWVD